MHRCLRFAEARNSGVLNVTLECHLQKYLAQYYPNLQRGMLILALVRVVLEPCNIYEHNSYSFVMTQALKTKTSKATKILSRYWS